MTDRERLAGYVDTWWQAVHDFLELLEEVPTDQWHAPTDLTGWDVHDVAAHIAHLEAVLAGADEETVEVGEPAHVRSPMGLYTEQGVVARKQRTPDELINEIREAATARHTALLADPPTDAAARPERIFGGITWDWERLLRNRPVDLWMHEQDVRRAVDLPGGMDSAGARHTATYLAESLGVVLAKRVGAPAGTTAVLEVGGQPAVAYVVTDAGRGERLPEIPDDPTVRLRLEREAFAVLAGGRREPDPGCIEVSGDEALGRQLLASFAVTP
jgi:uncharacterized protein (TIGR03083 family)